jgi:trehalose/maltose hydrolase-like predicted phosphorylase
VESGAYLHRHKLPSSVAAHHETLFSVGNGFVGVRGSLDEPEPTAAMNSSFNNLAGGAGLTSATELLSAVRPPATSPVTPSLGGVDDWTAAGLNQVQGATAKASTQHRPHRATYVNGVYDGVNDEPIAGDRGYHSEYTAGQRSVETTMIPVFDSTVIEASVDGIAINAGCGGLPGSAQGPISSPNSSTTGPTPLPTGEFIKHERKLDFLSASLVRTFTWKSDKGHVIECTSTRMPLLQRDLMHCVVTEYTLTVRSLAGQANHPNTAANNTSSATRSGSTTRARTSSTSHPSSPSSAQAYSSCDVKLASVIQCPKGRGLHVKKVSFEDGMESSSSVMMLRTKRSCIEVVAASNQRCQLLKSSGPHCGCSSPNGHRQATIPFTCPHHTAATPVNPVTVSENGMTLTSFSATLRPGDSLVLLKTVHYTSYGSLNEEMQDVRSIQGLLQTVSSRGMDQLMDEQRKELEKYWANADIRIQGSKKMQCAIRFNTLHLLMSAGRTKGTNVAAKGLTGELFGHYSWDSEIFIFPFFLFTDREVAKAMIQFRIDTLPEALHRASDLSLSKGALYPFRTLNGGESYTSTACTMQLHMNSDIAYAISLWLEVTEDWELLRAGGAAVVLATGLVWIQWGVWDDGEFHLRQVTGPDVYNALSNDNYYTNLFAQHHLHFATMIAKEFQQRFPSEWDTLCDAIQLTAEDIEEMERAAKSMALPYDSRLHLHLQEESMLKKHPWLTEAPSPTNQPQGNLLESYHPLTVYRSQICKQADVILCQVFLGDKFTMDDKRTNYEFYKPLTTHDSSLTATVFCIMAAELRKKAEAWEFFQRALKIDLDNLVGNSGAGIHAASMAGSWACVVRGFAGLRLKGNAIEFNPYLPEQWEEYGFQVSYKGIVVEVSVGRRAASYRALNNARTRILHGSTSIHLAKGRTVSIPLHSEVRSLEFDAVVLDLESVLGPELLELQRKSWEITLNAHLQKIQSELTEAAKTALASGLTFTKDIYLAYIRNHPSAFTSRPLAGLQQYLEERGFPPIPYDSDLTGSPFKESGTASSMTALAEEKRRILQNLVSQAKGYPKVKDGVLDFLKDLSANGVSIGCVSSSRCGQWLCKHLLSDIVFDCVVDAALANEADDRQGALEWRPEPEYILCCTQKLCVSPSRTVVILGGDGRVGYSRSALSQFALVLDAGQKVARASSSSHSTANAAAGTGKVQSSVVDLDSFVHLTTDDIDRMCNDAHSQSTSESGRATKDAGSRSFDLGWRATAVPSAIANLGTPLSRNHTTFPSGSFSASRNASV